MWFLAAAVFDQFNDVTALTSYPGVPEKNANLRTSPRTDMTVLSSLMQHRVVRWISTDVSEEHIASTNKPRKKPARNK
jgi:hypothetical protein